MIKKIIAVSVLIVATMLAYMVGSQSKKHVPAEPAPQTQPPAFAPPTATEVFNLRTKCAQLADELEKHFMYEGREHYVVSNYSARSNRCYAEIVTNTKDNAEFDCHLYDGQTRNLLAFTKMIGIERHGMVLVNGYFDKDCIDGDCRYEKASSFIDEKMHDEE